MAVCPKCDSDKIGVNRRNKNGTMYFKCHDCQHHFPGEERPRGEERVPQQEWTQRGPNQALAQGRIDSARAPTLDETIELFGIDTDIWRVDRFLVNRWGGDQPSYQIKLWLQRKVAEDTAVPPVQPVSIKLPARRARHRGQPPEKTTRAALLLPDGHIGYARDTRTGKLLPYHDRHVWDIVFQIGEYLQPDDVILQGDMLDCVEFTDKYTRTPEMYATFQPSLIELAWNLSRLRLVCPDARMAYLEGNHEERIPDHMARHLACVYGVEQVAGDYPALSVPHLLDLKSLDCEWLGGYPDNAVWLNDNLQVVHGDKSVSRPGASADKYLQEARYSVLFAHVHRAEKASKTRYLRDGERYYVAECFGMMGNPQRTPGAKSKQDWQQGIGVVYYDNEGKFEIHPVPIYGTTAYFNGKKFVGQDCTETLREQTGWEAF